MVEYTKKVMKEFLNPKNMGEMKNPDGVGKVGNPQCGDIMHVFIKVGTNKKGEEVLKDIKFKTFGCAAAIASSSMVTQVIKGKTLCWSRYAGYNRLARRDAFPCRCRVLGYELPGFENGDGSPGV